MVRGEVIEQFQRRLSEFLNVTREINRRLFIARNLRLQLLRSLPDGINHIAVVELSRVSPAPGTGEEIIVFAEEPPEQLDQLTAVFESLNRTHRYRGKFSHLFFMKWLDLLCADRRDAQSNFFARLQRPRAVNIQSISLGMLASKSELPVGLPEFIAAVQ
jgi:hypothetical protein